MNQIVTNGCPASTESESGMKKAGKLVCGYCIMFVAGIPVALVILAIAAKLLGYF
jgi:hypothetical protein